MNKPIVLASASPRRQEILTLAGIPYVVCPANDESAPTDLTPIERVCALARSKAQQVAVNHPDSIVLGADTMVVLDDRMLGKPIDKKDAVAMLMKLQGRVHQVMTGVWVVLVDAEGNIVKQDGFTDIVNVKFYPITCEEAQKYVETGEPMDKAGSYGIQGRGMRFVERIEGDFYTVMGLPGGRLIRFLNDFSDNPV